MLYSVISLKFWELFFSIQNTFTIDVLSLLYCINIIAKTHIYKIWSTLWINDVYGKNDGYCPSWIHSLPGQMPNAYDINQDAYCMRGLRNMH